jgi:hypothetical protein
LTPPPHCGRGPRVSSRLSARAASRCSRGLPVCHGAPPARLAPTSSPRGSTPGCPPFLCFTPLIPVKMDVVDPSHPLPPHLAAGAGASRSRQHFCHVVLSFPPLVSAASVTLLHCLVLPSPSPLSPIATGSPCHPPRVPDSIAASEHR